MATTSGKRRYIRSRAINPEPVEPPDAIYVRQRWIPKAKRDWVIDCDRIMLEYGSVQGQVVYNNRNTARWHAQALIRLMVELRLHGRDELREHTERSGNGYVWSIEYLGRNGDRRSGDG